MGQINYKELVQLSIFRGLVEKDIEKMLTVLGGQEKVYKKGEYIYRAGGKPSMIATVLSGRICIENVDVTGKKNIIQLLGPGEVFGEVYALLPDETVLVDAVADEEARVLLIDLYGIFAARRDGLTMTDSNRNDVLFLENLLQTIARKNLSLHQRILYSSPNKIRDRLLLFFSNQMIRQGSNHITMPFNRQQMADYLGLDRSALSRELGKMRDEGLIEFQRNKFIINKKALADE